MKGRTNMTIRSNMIREVLQAEAERAVRSGTDLWPAIRAAAGAHPMNKKSALTLGPTRLHGPARLAAAVSLALVIVVVGLLVPGREQGAAAAVLNKLAAVAAVQPAPM